MIDIYKEISKLAKMQDKCDAMESDIGEMIQEICDFPAGLTFCTGDGHLVINDNTANVCKVGILLGKTAENKLTEEEFENNQSGLGL